MLTILGTALIVCIIGIIFWSWWIVRYLLIIHPQKEIDSLRFYAAIAVNDTFLRHPHISLEQQRLQAEEKLRDILSEKGLTCTGYNTISAAIGSALYKKQQEEHHFDFERLKDELNKQQMRTERQTTSINLVAIKPKKTKAILALPTPKIQSSGEIAL